MTAWPQERSSTPRYSFDATALIKTTGKEEFSRVRVVGLGIAGCRIEVNRRLAENQQFQLTIRPNGEQIVANVTVRYWNAKGFAGVRFTGLSPEAKKRLKRLVDYISKTFTETDKNLRLKRLSVEIVPQAT